jgi:alpha-mannosidase
MKETEQNMKRLSSNKSSQTKSSQKTREALYVASTHWDREWYEQLQGFRMRLVHLLDEVFDHLEKDSSFSSFEMDGQVIPVLDYVEIRTKSGDRIRRLAKAGKFRMGPWFALPDEWLVSGESLVRNLQLGLEITAAYSSPRPTTAPMIDEFGHVSQMPQILSQLGFVGTFIHRGINMMDSDTNFDWESPDGTSIICHRLNKQGYGTLQIAYRRVLEPDEPFDFDKTVERLVEWTLLEGKRTPHGPILLLDSCDHVEIEPKASAIIAAANKKLQEHGIHIQHTNSDDFFAKVVSSFPAKRSKAIVGELRDSARDVATLDSTWLISGVLSSRVRLKQANARCEDELCLWAEPFGAFTSSALGLAYPSEFLAVAWRHLLENHAHDSICGCSVDQVHKDMEYRFDQSYGISRRLTDASLTAIARASAPDELGKEAVVITLFNSTANDITTPTDFQVRLPIAWSEKFFEFFGYEEKFSFRLKDSKGKEIPWQLNGQMRDQRGARRPHRKIPAEDTRHILDVTATVPIPAFGYTTLVVEPVPGPVRVAGSLRVAANALENEFLRLEVEDDGTVTLTHKRSGQSYRGLFTYEDSSDIGDGWNWCPAINDRVITSAGAPWTLSLEADGPEKATFQITTRLMVPEAFDFKNSKRSAAEKELVIRTRLTLRAGSDLLESSIEVENDVDDHRLRVFFPTNLKSNHYWSDTAFDAIQRPIALAKNNVIRRELDVDGRPQQSWAALEDGKKGLAVISRGLYESGVIERSDSPLFLTLLRGFRKAVFSNDNPGGQSRGRHNFRLELDAFQGKVPFQKLFSRGFHLAGPARQIDVLGKELLERPAIRLPGTHQFLQVEGDVVVTSVQAVEGNKWSIRFFNPLESAANFTFSKLGSVSAVSAQTLAGEPDGGCKVSLKGNKIGGTLSAKHISTLLVELKPNKA